MSRWGEDTNNKPGSSSNGSHSHNSSDLFFLDEEGWAFAVQRYMGAWVSAMLAAVAVLSPVVMLLVPQMGVVHFRESQLRCDVS